MQYQNLQKQLNTVIEKNNNNNSFDFSKFRSFDTPNKKGGGLSEVESNQIKSIKEIFL